MQALTRMELAAASAEPLEPQARADRMPELAPAAARQVWLAPGRQDRRAQVQAPAPRARPVAQAARADRAAGVAREPQPAPAQQMAQAPPVALVAPVGLVVQVGLAAPGVQGARVVLLALGQRAAQAAPAFANDGKQIAAICRKAHGVGAQRRAMMETLRRPDVTTLFG